MEIKFTIEPDLDAEDDFTELFTADILFEDNTSLRVQASDTDITYDAFRADIFEDLFRSITEVAGINLIIEEDDYATFDDDEIDVILADYQDSFDEDDIDNVGC